MKRVIQLLRQLEHFPRPIRDYTAYKEKSDNAVLHRVVLPDGRVFSVDAEIHIEYGETETRIYDVIEIDPKEHMIKG